MWSTLMYGILVSELGSGALWQTKDADSDTWSGNHSFSFSTCRGMRVQDDAHCAVSSGQSPCKTLEVAMDLAVRLPHSISSTSIIVTIEAGTYHIIFVDPVGPVTIRCPPHINATAFTFRFRFRVVMVTDHYLKLQHQQYFVWHLHIFCMLFGGAMHVTNDDAIVQEPFFRMLHWWCKTLWFQLVEHWVKVVEF
jgi:hypothetical protein